MKRFLLYPLLAVLALVALALAAFRWQASQREVVPAELAAPAGGRYVRAADTAIFVQETGPAEGPPVLFVHGTGAWSEAWRGAMTAAAATGARALALDLPPFGFSQRPADARYDKLAQGRRIAAVLAALDLKDVILVGHSFGGGPTVEAALLAPERVRALVLVDAALSIGAEAAVPDSSLLVRGVLAVRPLRDSLVATFLTNPRFTRRLLQGFIDNPVNATDQWVQLYQRPLVVAGTTEAVGAWLPALLTPKEVAASERPSSYRGLKIPVLLIWGERDRITPPHQGELVARLAPGGGIAILKGVGHIPQIEDPAGFNKLLLAAIARASSASSSR